MASPERGENHTVPINVVLYSRRGCHLCDEAKRALDKVSSAVPFQVEEVDIDRHRFLRKAFSEEVPVLWARGKKICKFRVDPGVFSRFLDSLFTRYSSHE